MALISIVFFLRSRRHKVCRFKIRIYIPERWAKPERHPCSQRWRRIPTNDDKLIEMKRALARRKVMHWGMNTEIFT